MSLCSSFQLLDRYCTYCRFETLMETVITKKMHSYAKHAFNCPPMSSFYDLLYTWYTSKKNPNLPLYKTWKIYCLQAYKKKNEKGTWKMKKFS